MNTYFTYETEAEARRREFERTAAADARAAQASRANPMRRWLPRLTRSSEGVAARSLPSMPIGALVELPRVPRPVAC
jgi:hypothetical protein